MERSHALACLVTAFSMVAGWGAMPTTALAVNLMVPTQVVARVGATCSSMVAGVLDFGTLPATPALGVSRTDATGTVVITCSNAVAFSVVANTGTYASGSQRRMQAASGVYMEYDIYTSSARTTSYPSSGATQSYTSDGSPSTVTAYGRVRSQFLTGFGAFQDVLTWTVTY